MNKTERKIKIKEFIEISNECIQELKDCKQKENTLRDKIDELNALTDEYSLGEDLFDTDKMHSTITSELILSTSFNDVHEELTSYMDELDEYSSDLSESKADELSETYEDWSELTDLFEVSDEDTLDDIIVNLERVVEILEERIKEKRI